MSLMIPQSNSATSLSKSDRDSSAGWQYNLFDEPKSKAEVTEWAGVFRRLVEFTKLPQNWDTYGGVPSSLVAYGRTVYLLRQWQELTRFWGETLPIPFVTLCGNGSIQLEWSLGRKSVEIEVPSDDSLAFGWMATLDTSGEPKDYTGGFQDVSEDQAKQLIRWLLQEK